MSKNREHRRLDKYYNNELLCDIMNLISVDINQTAEKLSEYILHYPRDYNAYCMYASVLVRIRKYEEAEKILDTVDNMYKTKTVYYDKEKDELFRLNYSISKIKLYSYTNRLNECFNYIKANRRVLDRGGLDLKILRHYCLTNLNRDTNKYKISEETSYIYHQIIEYSEEEFRKRIERHRAEYELKDGETTAGVFFKEFPLEKVLEEIKKYIPNSKYGYCVGFYEDSYYFKYDGCGRSMTNKNRKNSKEKNYQSKHIVADYFKVITFHDSPNMITICPCTETDGLPYIDLNYIKEQTEPKPVKKDKVAMFYKRYSNSIDKK